MHSNKNFFWSISKPGDFKDGEIVEPKQIIENQICQVIDSTDQIFNLHWDYLRKDRNPEEPK